MYPFARVKLIPFGIGFATITFVAPAEDAVVVTYIAVEPINVPPTRSLPIVTVAPDMNPQPFTVITVPPQALPLPDRILLMDILKVYPFISVVLIPFGIGFVTITFVGPGDDATVVTYIAVEPINVPPDMALPIVTVAPDMNPQPFTVTTVPPHALPLDGNALRMYML